MISKSQLAIELSKLEVFESPKVRLEQYPTDSEVAAEGLWQAWMLGDVEGKIIADLGAGTGILGLGALLLGALRVYFVECEGSCLQMLGKNLTNLAKTHNFEEKVRVQNGDIKDFFCDEIEIVIQNPPFGVKVRGKDLEFLEKAISLAPVVYSFHKTSTEGFIEAKMAEKGVEVSHKWRFDFPLKASMGYHKKHIERVNVTLFRLVRAKIDRK